MIIDLVTQTIRSILLEDADVVSRLAASRKRSEGWLQIEIFKRFLRRFPEIETVPDRSYSSSGLDRCDLWCREPGGNESWVELKTCVTNYEQKFGSTTPRPITNQISEVLRDMGRLARLPIQAVRHLFLLVYPMPATEILPPQWSSHLNRLRDGGRNVARVLTAPVCVKVRKANVIGYTIVI